MTLEELKALYKEKGATQARENYTEQGTTVDQIPIQYGEGWSAWEKAPVQIGTQGDGMDAQPIFDTNRELGGFTKQEGDWVTAYDLAGNVVDRHKWNENMLKSTIQDLGPMALMALTAGGGAGLLGESLFGLQGAAAAGAGGALAGGVNAWGNDQNILKGALTGALSGAGSAKLVDILGADTVGQTFKNATVGDVNKAINLVQNPTLAGAANLASPYVTTNFDIGDTGFTTNDLLKGVNTVQALGSGDNKKIFDAITGLAKGTDFSGLTATEQAERDANRETARLNRIEDAVLNQPASDDGSTQGIVDLISEMYPTAGVKGMSEGELAKFLEANINEIQGSAELETLLKGQGQTTADEGTVNITGERPTGLGDFMLPTSNIGDQGEMVVTANRDKLSLDDFINLNNPVGDTTNNYGLTDEGEVVITADRPTPYVPSIRTKEIKSDIPDEITIDEITKLFPDADINEILELVTATTPVTKVTPVTKTTPVTPVTKVTPSTPKTTEELLANLGLGSGQAAPSQDPYANIKSMEDLFGGDIAYKLRALGAPRNLASTDMDALTRLLRNQNG